MTEPVTFDGGSGPDIFVAGNTDDTLSGNAGKDVLSGAGGDDTLSGGDGDDILTGGSGGDSLDGGAGVDTLSYEGSAGGVSVDLSTGSVSGGDAEGDTITGFENVRGSSGFDVLIGSSADNVLEGGAGGDMIFGGDGNDTVSYEHSFGGVRVTLGSGTSGAPTGEIQVNTTTANTQEEPATAALSGGGYVVIWSSYDQDGDNYGVYGQRFDASGNAVGSEFLVNTTTSDDQRRASIAALSGGGFVVTWDSYDHDGGGWGVYGQRYDSFGNTIGSEFLVNTFTDGNQDVSSVAALSGGGFVVTWGSYAQDGSSWGVYGQRYDSSGNAVGSEFLVNTFTDGNQGASSVVARSGGGFVVTWDSKYQDGSGWGVFGQWFDSNGSAVSSEFQVNSYALGGQSQSSVTEMSDGGILVTWASDGQDGSGYGVCGQRYDSSGNAVGSEILINTYTVSNQSSPSITALNDGGFVVTWNSYGQDGAQNGVFGQRFDSAGDAIGPEFQVNMTTDGNERMPVVTAPFRWGFAIVWTGI